MVTDERQGNIFDSDYQTIAIPTNCVGVMGKGLALEAKQRYPHVESPYREACRQGLHDIGKPLMVQVTDERWLLLFATKRHWRQPSKLDWIEEGLRALRYDSVSFPFNQIMQLAVPPLGCGLGGLAYSDVKALLYRYLEPWPVEVILYKP